MNNIELKNLIFKISRSKDRLAFVDIFEYFAPRIMGYLVGFGLKKENAEEITQEVMSSVWQKAYQFNPEKANVSTWVFSITRNKRIDKLRKNEKPEYNTKDLIENLYPNINRNIKEIEEKITELQSKLDQSEKKLIKMNFFEGKSHKIISRELEIPLGTVKSKIRTILNKMREK